MTRRIIYSRFPDSLYGLRWLSKTIFKIFIFGKKRKFCQCQKEEMRNKTSTYGQTLSKRGCKKCFSLSIDATMKGQIKQFSSLRTLHLPIELEKKWMIVYTRRSYEIVILKRKGNVMNAPSAISLILQWRREKNSKIFSKLSSLHSRPMEFLKNKVPCIWNLDHSPLHSYPWNNQKTGITLLFIKHILFPFFIYKKTYFISLSTNFLLLYYEYFVYF